jgi:hypothetical protein
MRTRELVVCSVALIAPVVLAERGKVVDLRTNRAWRVCFWQVTNLKRDLTGLLRGHRQISCFHENQARSCTRRPVENGPQVLGGLGGNRRAPQ